MNELYESLYDARRNAISSWQGYHYQGMVALQCFLEELLRRYNVSEDEAAELKMKIEWIEDFTLFEKEEPTNLDIFMIDDPCQSLDELNVASLVEIIKNEFTKTQIILSTHEDKIASYIKYKSEKAGKK